VTEFPEYIKTVCVNSFGERSGILTQPAQFNFSYDGEVAVSLTMSLNKKEYNHGALHPIFAQNLPEGYVRRYICEKLERHARVNDLYLLALQQDKGIGHLSFESDIGRIDAEDLSLGDILHWEGKESIFPELLNKYYLGGFASGVQPKVLLDNVKASVNQHDLIVKSFDDEFPLLTVNEFVCMSAAKKAGLNPPNFWLSDDQRTFVIERFDRPDSGLLAIEDFSTLTGADKYRSSYEVVLKAVQAFTKKPTEVARAYSYIVFNCLIGNGDAHLKNFAIQYDQNRSDICLTPPYDITHTLIYPALDKDMALKMDSAKAFPNKDALLKLAKQFNIKRAEVIIEQMAQAISESIKESDVINQVNGLKASIESSLGSACSSTISKPAYRHDKKRKYDKNPTNGIAKS